jgi:hypothetical protein
MAGTPTNNPPKMHTYRKGEWDSFAPGIRNTAHRTPNAMKKKPTPVGTGFPPTFICRLFKPNASR